MILENLPRRTKPAIRNLNVWIVATSVLCVSVLISTSGHGAAPEKNNSIGPFNQSLLNTAVAAITENQVEDDPVDSHYGPQTENISCPGIEPSAESTTFVSSFSQFDIAYRSANPGDAIVIKDGSYDWTQSVSTSTKFKRAANRPYELNRSGTQEAPIYILAESLQGVHFATSRVDWVFSGSHHVFAGFKLSNPGRLYVRSPDNRIACNYFSDAKASYIYTENSNADRVEIDNNVFDGGANNAIVLWRCNPVLPNCTKNSKGAHIHHNTFKNKQFTNTNGHEAIVLGLGYAPVPEARTYNADGDTMDAVIENNLFDGWNGESELITIKSSRNIIRNNCVINSPKANFKVRTGNDNLITGNWLENAGGGIEISGKRNYIVFNYKGRKSNNYFGFRLHTGEQFNQRANSQYNLLYRYIDASDNTLRYNVFSGIAYLVDGYPRINAIFRAQPTGNTISDNAVYSTAYRGTNENGGYYNSDGRLRESDFRGTNNWGDNFFENRELPASHCGNPDLFFGPGGQNATISGSSELLGGPEIITAPSWW